MSDLPATVAALYIDVARGPYAALPGVELWGEQRDARLYCGPHPVVAHPPCAAWGNYRLNRFTMARKHEWSTREWDRSGAQMVCGPVAVDQVRRFGGVLEHPAHSALWLFCGLPLPGLFADRFGGRTVEVFQGAYGHHAPKRTWLYVVGADPSFNLLQGGAGAKGRVERMWSTRRHLTPSLFATTLVALARACRMERTCSG